MVLLKLMELIHPKLRLEVHQIKKLSKRILILKEVQEEELEASQHLSRKNLGLKRRERKLNASSVTELIKISQ